MMRKLCGILCTLVNKPDLSEIHLGYGHHFELWVLEDDSELDEHLVIDMAISEITVKSLYFDC